MARNLRICGSISCWQEVKLAREKVQRQLKKEKSVVNNTNIAELLHRVFAITFFLYNNTEVY